MTWNDQFLALFRDCLEKYEAGNKDFTSYYSAKDLILLQSIGYKPRELFDFVEDFAEDKGPSVSTALLIAAVRRDYFHTVQNGNLSSHTVSPSDLPSSSETLDGISYFPRILAKARAKLKGELDPDIMYSCGGDRKFLMRNGNIDPADFLRNVWFSKESDEHIINYVYSKSI